jgi:hypothetical protein
MSTLVLLPAPVLPVLLAVHKVDHQETQKVETHLHQQELSVFARLQRMGGRANDASFGITETAALKELIARGIVRRVGRFEVEVAPAGESVREANKPQSGSEVRSTNAPAERVPQDPAVNGDPPGQASVQQRPERITATTSVRKLSYRKLERLRPDRIRGLAARIVERLEVQGPEIRVRTLERLLHAERFPEWADALALLTAKRSITTSGRLITLADPMAAEKLPDPYPQQKVRRKRRRRPRTEWFEARLRRAEELGVPVNDIIELDRGGPRLLG